MLSAGLDHVGPRGALKRSLAIISHRGLMGVPCVNSSMLEARGTELTKACGRTRSVGWTSSICGGLDQVSREGEAFEAGL